MEIIYGTSTEYRHLIRTAGTVIAVLKDTGTTRTDYIHRDHLGSLTAITNSSGTVQERLAYDAWGQRRDATDWDGTATATEKRGFTGHEHMDDVGAIHMNGRVYSPKLGRFLSPDPVTQAPENGQNYNRYAYAFNNPLKYTDPSGYEFTLAVAVPSIIAWGFSLFGGGGCDAACQYRNQARNWCQTNSLCTQFANATPRGRFGRQRNRVIVNVYDWNFRLPNIVFNAGATNVSSGSGNGAKCGVRIRRRCSTSPDETPNTLDSVVTRFQSRAPYTGCEWTPRRRRSFGPIEWQCPATV